MKKRIPFIMMCSFLILQGSAGAGDLTVNGKIGVGTTNPTAPVHLKNGNMRIEGAGQIGINTFIYSDTPDSSATISGQKFGGTMSSPMITPNNTQLLRLTGGGYDGTQIRYTKASIIYRASEDWNTSGQGTRIEFRTTPNGTTNPALQLVITDQGFLGIGNASPTEKLYVSGNIYATGTITQGSSRELKDDIENLSIEEAMNAFQVLQPVKYRYKADSKDLQIGFIAEDVPEIVASADRKSLSPMDIVAVLTKVVQEQQKVIEDLSKRVDSIDK